VRRPQVGMNPARFYFPAFISVFRIPWNAFDRAQVRMPGALFTAFSTPATERRRGGPARLPLLSQSFSPRITRRRRSISSRGSSARRAGGGARSLRPESSGGPGKLAAALSMPATERRGRGPARSSRLFRRWRLSAGTEARRPPGPRCCFLGAGNRSVWRRRDELAAAFLAPATEGRSKGRARSPRFSRPWRSSAR